MNHKNLNSIDRFSSRVSDYALYRPSYPNSLLDFLESRIGLADSRVADIGAGTGILSKLLLEREALVTAVEPNIGMLNVAIKNLVGHHGFRSQMGTAEETGLPTKSVNLITCAQAFHWFDPVKSRLEFNRIMSEGARVALILLM